jgi:hypothetical protein
VERWKAVIPPQVTRPFQVYVNGVAKQEGEDYEVHGDKLEFREPLTQEGKLGFWRWFMGAWGIGTYREHHTIDVTYQVEGRPQVAHALEVRAPGRPPGARDR